MPFAVVHRTESMPAVPLLGGRQDRPALRWLALGVAAIGAGIAARACTASISGMVGPLKILLSRPINAWLLAVLALHVWAWLFAQTHAAREHSARISFSRLILWIGAVESGMLATIGAMATDLQWKTASIMGPTLPTYVACLSFILATLGFLREDPSPQMRAILQRGLAQWRIWNWGARIVLLVGLVQAGLMGKSLVAYWHLSSSTFSHYMTPRPTQIAGNGSSLPTFSYFCDKCQREIPSDARILYHGPNQGLVLAYEIYPRRVFMLPSEQRTMFTDCWRNERWCRGMKPDPMLAIWKWDPPLPNVSEMQFIAEHEITYVVSFDEDNISNCCIQKLR
jgi:hypothetical protein